MKKSSVFIMVLVILIMTIIVGSVSFAKPALSDNPVPKSFCKNHWRKIFEGEYGPYTPSPDTYINDTYFINMTGITPNNLSTLRNLILQGCDVKIQILPQGADPNSPSGYTSKSIFCSAIDFFDTPLHPFIECRFAPYFEIGYQETKTEVLYGSLRFRINDTLTSVEISRGYTYKDERGNELDTSFFSTGWHDNSNGKTKVAIFVKK